VGDLDRDGHPDAVTAIADATKSRSFGTWETARAASRTLSAIPAGAIAPDVGDYNGDGWPDVASANYAQGTMSLRTNLGNGALVPG
jgi:hypothetical protein